MWIDFFKVFGLVSFWLFVLMVICACILWSGLALFDWLLDKVGAWAVPITLTYFSLWITLGVTLAIRMG